MPAKIFSYILDLIFPTKIQVDEQELLKYRCIKKKDDCTYIFPYTRVVKEGIHRMKYKDDIEITKIFAETMEKILPEGYILVPIPIHIKRRRERGYNQCERLCKYMNRKSDFNILKRIKYAEKNSKSNIQTRKENIKGSFKITKDVNNIRIILIDDVYTTGATMNEAKQTLLESGAEEVLLFSIAH